MLPQGENTMKAIVPLSVLSGVCLLVSLVAAEDVVPQPGWTREQVIEALGEPPGLIRSEEIEVLHYERGPVNLRSNRVVSAALVSTEQALRLRAERERRAVIEARTRSERKEQLIVEGTAERERLLASPQTFSMPVEQQVQLWEDFTRHYPDVRVTDLLLGARGKYQEDLEKEEIRRRLAEVEYRTREAELRARNAEEEARRKNYYGGYFPYWSYPNRIRISGRPDCPERPTVLPGRPPVLQGIGVNVGTGSGYGITTGTGGSIITIRPDR
jgi:hypothetical protein